MNRSLATGRPDRTRDHCLHIIRRTRIESLLQSQLFSQGSFHSFSTMGSIAVESKPAGLEPATLGSYPSSGIDVLIVGTGLAGLTAAIECTRKGHNVLVLERHDSINTAGKPPVNIQNAKLLTVSQATCTSWAAARPSSSSIGQNWPQSTTRYLSTTHGLRRSSTTEKS